MLRFQPSRSTSDSTVLSSTVVGSCGSHSASRAGSAEASSCV
jgi:hypothetical protein